MTLLRNTYIIQKHVPMKYVYMHLVNGVPCYFDGMKLRPMTVHRSKHSQVYGNFVRESLREIYEDQACHAMWAVADPNNWGKLKKRLGFLANLRDPDSYVYFSFIKLSIPQWQESVIAKPTKGFNRYNLIKNSYLKKYLAKYVTTRYDRVEQIPDALLSDFFSYLQLKYKMRFMGQKTKPRTSWKDKDDKPKPKKKPRKIDKRRKSLYYVSKLGRTITLSKPKRREPEPS